jgi:hypothetical protein
VKLTFCNWKDALMAVHDVKIEPAGALYLMHEGSVKDTPYEGSDYPHSWTKGTGRYVLSDHRTGEQVAIIYRGEKNQ